MDNKYFDIFNLSNLTRKMQDTIIIAMQANHYNIKQWSDLYITFDEHSLMFRDPKSGLYQELFMNLQTNQILYAHGKSKIKELFSFKNYSLEEIFNINMEE